MKSSPANSVSLKFSKSSVMLYENRYLPAADGRPGSSAQIYVASFSTAEAELPAGFAAKLRQLTESAPERYDELVSRVEERVLEPQRAKRKADEVDRALMATALALERASTSVVRVAESVEAGRVFPNEETRAAAAALVQAMKRLGAAMQSQTATPALVTLLAVEHALKVTTPVHEAPEQRLLRLLTLAHQTNADLRVALEQVPKGRAFRFQDATVRTWQQLWYSTADMQSALTSRAALARPRGWSELRERVAAGEVIRA